MVCGLIGVKTMWASTITQLSLFEWAEVLQISPWEVAQIGDGVPLKSDRHCSDVFFQYGWQRDHLSREEVADAIRNAEDTIAMHLGYYPAPKFIAGEPSRYPEHFNTVIYGDPVTPKGQWKPIKLDWKYVQGGGLFNRTEISANESVTLSDEGTGVNDTFTLSVATTVTDPDEIAIYFSAANRLGEDISEKWRIRPINVSIASGTATIKGHVTLLVDPALQVDSDADPLDAGAAPYVTTVDVYRAFRDTTATDANPKQGTAEWDKVPGDDDDAVVLTKGIRLGAYNSKLGLVTVQIPQTWPQQRQPDKVSINYEAGIPRVNGRMNKQYAQMVARLSVALLARHKCGCERTNRIMRYWAEWPSTGDGTQTRARPLTTSEIDSPMGPRWGARWTWEQIQRLRLDV